MATRDESGRASRHDDEVKSLTAQISFLDEEIAVLRRRLADSPRQVRLLEERLRETEASLTGVSSQNERLAATLREARDQIVALKEEIDRLAQPPSGFGVFLSACEDDTADVFTGGRKMRVNVSPERRPAEAPARGQEVMLNEALNVVIAQGYRDASARSSCSRKLLADGERALVISPGRRGAGGAPGRPAAATRRCAPATRCCWSPAPATSTSGSPRPRSRSWSWKRCRTSTTRHRRPGPPDRADPGRRRAAVPARRPVQEHQLEPPKGVLLYGPPGCGKTLIAKAVANSLAKQVAPSGTRVATMPPSGRASSSTIKGPELLNKYVGETERHIRLVFQRAREKASEGRRSSSSSTRWTRCSAPAARACPARTWRTPSSRSCCREIDGVEGLENVIVIGASNREDMIDPAILRPGRLDVKIKIERPDAEAATRHLLQVPHRRTCRCIPTTSPSTAGRARRRSPG